ncbi:MAG: Allergen V5/Tpx family protein [Candidatus Solibacter sp.]|nr:Allergen V5/Tpx family protein [Candidatus Solibacter sp.]
MSKTLSALIVTCVFLTAHPANAQTPTLDAEQSAFVTLINNYRAQNGAGPLQVSVALQQSAQWMSADMAAKNYFSHTDSLGRDPFNRMTAFGYTHYPEGENIAAGYSDAQNTFTQWQTACDPDSTGACTYAHRQNMLNPGYKVLGIGRVYNASSSYRWYWTTDFGGFVDQTIGSTTSQSLPVITSFTANPATITTGQVSTLSWTVSGATSIIINNGDVTSLTSKVVVPSSTTQYTLTATNSAGSKTATVTVTVNSSGPVPTPSPTSVSIWSSTAVPPMYLSVNGAVELGVKFRSDVAGKITGIRFYKNSSNTGIHSGSLWSANGQLLASGVFSNETASGWQTLTFSVPVTIAANTTYIASYHTNASIASVGFELQAKGVDNPPLHALQTGVAGYNGVYIFGGGGIFPTQGTSGYNFWVDVVFVN